MNQKIETIKNKIRITRILEKRGLGFVLDHLVQNHPEDIPYHDAQHMIDVALTAHDIAVVEYSPLYGDRNAAMDRMLVAALLHDFGHSGGLLSDEKNIELAITLGLEPLKAQLNFLHKDSTFSKDVEKLIRLTIFPRKDIPMSVHEKALLDADVLQAYSNNGIVKVIEGLRAEMKAGGNAVTLMEMAERQKEFFETIELHTYVGNTLLNETREEMISLFREYACKNTKVYTPLTLRDFGFAPGGYMINCIKCQQTAIDCDKRSFHCKTCAEKLLKEHEAEHAS